MQRLSDSLNGSIDNNLVTNILQSWRWIPEVRFINQYFEEENYVKAIANSIDKFWIKNATKIRS